MALPTELPKGAPQSWSDLRRFPCSARLLAQLEAVAGWQRGEFPQSAKDGDLFPLLIEAIEAAIAHGETLPEHSPMLTVALWDLTDPRGVMQEHPHIEAYPGNLPSGRCRVNRLVGSLRWQGSFRVREFPPFWRVTEFDGELPFGDIAVATAAEWKDRWAGLGEDLVWPASRFGLADYK